MARRLFSPRFSAIISARPALLLVNPELAFNPFYGLVPQFFLYPMVALATIATVIASQALISGVFSLTQQAIDLGYCPRLLVVHTSSEIKGQIYVPAVNYALMVACLGVVIAFRESSGLAGAYGISVTGTMNITSTLFFLLSTRGWGWPVWKAAPLVILFLIFDSSYFLANLLKIVDGGWFTLFIAALITLFLTTWRKGRSELYRKLGTRLPLKVFLEDLARHNIPRVKGTAVFLSVNPEGTSPVLLHHLKHTKVLHERVILLSMMTANRPVVKAGERVDVEDLGQGFFSVVARNGFMQRPNVPEIMKLAAKHGLQIQSGGNDLLLRAGHDLHPRRFEDDALAQNALRLHGEGRRKPHGLFQPSRRPGGGIGGPGPAVKSLRKDSEAIRKRARKAPFFASRTLSGVKEIGEPENEVGEEDHQDDQDAGRDQEGDRAGKDVGYFIFGNDALENEKVEAEGRA